MTNSTVEPVLCPVCDHQGMNVYFEAEGVPVFCNVLWDSREEALAAARAGIRLAFCPDCGFNYNVAFDPRLVEYTPTYENSLHHSARFQQYAESLAKRLVERYQLWNKDVIEIGCGQGDFLRLLVELGGNHGVGFDPSCNGGAAPAASHPDVKILPEVYSEAHRNYPADLVCCRHVLEHIAQPHDFLVRVRQAIGDRSDTTVFFEVPNALYTIEEMGIWDIIYEHCAYFTPASLARLFVRAGFDPIAVTESYEGQFLTIEAHPTNSTAALAPGTNCASTEPSVRAFRDAYRTKVERWHHVLARFRANKAKAVVWGAGSKGIAFLNTMDASFGVIRYAVDLNPRKQGRYVTGTGQKIVGPDFLKTYRPDAVVVMNPIYRNEIRQHLEGMELCPEILVA